MELFQVRYFLALAKSLNFTRAAEACNVSQPALTRAIQRLEDELGGPLLYRERSLTQLTALGQAMLPHLEAAHAAAETAAAQAAAFRRRDSAPLRLGMDDTISAAILAPALVALREKIKGVEFSLSEAPSPALIDRLLEGKLDSALLVEPEKPPERLERWRLFRDRYVVLCPDGHPLARLDAVPVRALGEEGIIGRDREDSNLQQALTRLCAAHGVTPQLRLSCAGEDQVRQMVAAGLGIALSAGHQPAGGGIVARPLADRTAFRDIVVAAVAGRPHSPALTAFLKLMRARDWGDPAAAEVSKP